MSKEKELGSGTVLVHIDGRLRQIKVIFTHPSIERQPYMFAIALILYHTSAKFQSTRMFGTQPAVDGQLNGVVWGLSALQLFLLQISTSSTQSLQYG